MSQPDKMASRNSLQNYLKNKSEKHIDKSLENMSKDDVKIDQIDVSAKTGKNVNNQNLLNLIEKSKNNNDENNNNFEEKKESEQVKEKKEPLNHPFTRVSSSLIIIKRLKKNFQQKKLRKNMEVLA